MDLVLIPAYEPDYHLTELAETLSNKGFTVLVVDDGSGESFKSIFEEVSKNAIVVTHENNRGKCAALKTGMHYIKDNLPECENFITCDADGQHRIEDVERVRDCLHKGEKFVLTVRRTKKDVPLRSKVGNSLSRFVYALLTNKYLSDNQSGLRGFSRIHLDWLIAVEKDNYDYEMNMLYYAAKKGVKISTIPIEAIYIDNNQSSHFNPIKDTSRIYKSLFWLARGTFIGFIVSEIAILLATIFLGYDKVTFTVPSAGALSYLIAFILNKFIIFRHTYYYDYWNSLIYTVISYLFYTLGCSLFMYSQPQLPLWIAFNIIYIACIPLRYCLHKFIFVAARTREY